jgi:hypothetical protein
MQLALHVTIPVAGLAARQKHVVGEWRSDMAEARYAGRPGASGDTDYAAEVRSTFCIRSSDMGDVSVGGASPNGGISPNNCEFRE